MPAPSCSALQTKLEQLVLSRDRHMGIRLDYQEEAGMLGCSKTDNMASVSW